MMLAFWLFDALARLVGYSVLTVGTLWFAAWIVDVVVGYFFGPRNRV